MAMQRDVVAVRREIERDRPADAPGGAGDQHHGANRRRGGVHGSYNAAMQSNEGTTVYRRPCRADIDEAIAAAGGWIGFDRFMAMALYEPGWATTAANAASSAPCPSRARLRHRARARRCSAARWRARWQALAAAGSGECGSSAPARRALAAQLLESLGERVTRYTIVDLSGSLRARQRERLAAFGDKLRWVDALPERQRRDRRQRGARRDAGAAAALRRRAVAGTRRGARGRRFVWPDRPPSCARRWRRPSCRHRHRDPCAGARLRRHAGRAARTRRRLLHRLRLSGGRILAPAAPRRHADVPPRAPQRRRSARRRGRRTSPPTSTSPASPWPRRTPAWT